MRWVCTTFQPLMISPLIYLFRWWNVRRCIGLSIYIALYTYTKYTVYTLNLHQIYTYFIVYFTHAKKTGEIHLLFDVWMNQNITSKNTPEWVPGTRALNADTRKSSPFMLMKEMFLLMNHADVATVNVAVIIWHLRNISRNIRPIPERTLPDGSSWNRPKLYQWLTYHLHFWWQTLIGPVTTCFGSWLKSLVMLRQTVSLMFIV